MRLPNPIVVHIFWNQVEKTGTCCNRSIILKHTGHYRPHIRFKETEKMWGVGMEIKAVPCKEEPTIAIIEYSFESIPSELIKIGQCFDILAGPQIIAEGIIVEILLE